MSNNKVVNATAFYLENTLPGHHKFYLIVVTDDGVVTTSWGKIGTSGQSKIQQFQSPADAQAVGMERFFSKRTGGYVVKDEGIKFQIPESVVASSCENGTTWQITRAFWEAKQDPQFEGDKGAVLSHYDELLKKAQRLMDDASGMNFESVQIQFEQLEQVWKEIEDKHDEIKVTMDFTRQMLGAALLSGKL